MSFTVPNTFSKATKDSLVNSSLYLFVFVLCDYNVVCYVMYIVVVYAVIV